MTQWVPAWIRQGWKRKTGPVENADLWRELVEAAARHRVEWRWVRGHAGHPRNEYANDLAVHAAKTLTSSNGLVESGFEAWLEVQREKGRYLDFMEFEAPDREETA
jgi:ribonuclease HI